MAGSKRLLVITELYLPTKGGTAVWFDEVYRRLGGRELHVVTRLVPGSAEHDKDHPNTIHRLKLERNSWLKPESLAMYVKLCLKSLVLALGQRFEAIHAGRVLPEGLVALLVARITRLPCVVYAHGEEITTWRQPTKLRIMRWVYLHAHKIIANSQFTYDELRKLGVSHERITIIHPGVDTARFRPGLPFWDLQELIGLKEGEHLVVSVGRLSRRKGFDQLIRALPLVTKRGIRVRLAIIGIGEDENYLRDVVAECQVADRVHLLGHVPPDDLPRWLNAAELFAMPNRDIEGDNEGFGMVFLEAAACGKPVVAGRDGGTTAAVVDGITGLQVNGNSVEDVAHAVAGLLSDTARARSMGDAALKRVIESFSWAHVVARTRSI
ncbi:MAG: glycosyltransferase family 4 protein [Burkholderiales bacterium]